MNIQLYLQRIAYQGSLEPTADTLRQIHRAQMLSVPFENLDIHFRRPIKLDLDSFFGKIVKENRGGFCYELNGLFAEALRSLGFQVTMLSAKVARPAGDFGPEFDHMTLLVQLKDRWIADVGFGDSFVEPLLLDSPDEQEQSGKQYRFIRSDEGAFIYQALEETQWMSQYTFQLLPHQLHEYESMCTYHQTSPESTFTQKVVCSRATEDGRITLTDKKLILTSGKHRQEKVISSKDEFLALLQQHFGIKIPGIRNGERASQPAI